MPSSRSSGNAKIVLRYRESPHVVRSRVCFSQSRIPLTTRAYLNYVCMCGLRYEFCFNWVVTLMRKWLPRRNFKRNQNVSDDAIAEELLDIGIALSFINFHGRMNSSDAACMCCLSSVVGGECFVG